MQNQIHLRLTYVIICELSTPRHALGILRDLFFFFTEVSYTIASLPKSSKVISMVYDTWL